MMYLRGTGLLLGAGDVHVNETSSVPGFAELGPTDKQSEHDK